MADPSLRRVAKPAVYVLLMGLMALPLTIYIVFCMITKQALMTGLKYIFVAPTIQAGTTVLSHRRKLLKASAIRAFNS